MTYKNNVNIKQEDYRVKDSNEMEKKLRINVKALYCQFLERYCHTSKFILSPKKNQLNMILNEMNVISGLFSL